MSLRQSIHINVSLGKTLYPLLSTGLTQEDMNFRNHPDMAEKLFLWDVKH